MVVSDCDEYEPSPGANNDSSHASAASDSPEREMKEPDVFGEHCNQPHPYHAIYAEWQAEQRRRRGSLSIDGLDSGDDDEFTGSEGDQRVEPARRRVSRQRVSTQRAQTPSETSHPLDDTSPAPEREPTAHVVPGGGDASTDTAVPAVTSALQDIVVPALAAPPAPATEQTLAVTPKDDGIVRAPLGAGASGSLAHGQRLFWVRRRGERRD